MRIVRKKGKRKWIEEKLKAMFSLEESDKSHNVKVSMIKKKNIYKWKFYYFFSK